MRTVKVALVVVSLIMAFPALTVASNSNAELGGVMSSEKKWPCCDDCGICTRSFPPICRCNDERPGSCHSSCKACEQTESTSEYGTPLYRCLDFLPCFCERKCTASADYRECSTSTTVFKSVFRRLVGDDDWPDYCPPLK